MQFVFQKETSNEIQLCFLDDEMYGQTIISTAALDDIDYLFFFFLVLDYARLIIVF